MFTKNKISEQDFVLEFIEDGALRPEGRKRKVKLEVVFALENVEFVFSGYVNKDGALVLDAESTRWMKRNIKETSWM